MAGCVKSINHYELTTATNANEVTQDLSGLSGVNLSYCVPFHSTHVSSVPTGATDTRQCVTRSWITTGDSTLRVSRDYNDSTGATTSHVYVVEFDNARCNVYTGAFNMPTPGGLQSVTVDMGGTLASLSNAFLYFSYFQNSGTSAYLTTHMVKGNISSLSGGTGGETEITFEREDSVGTVDGTWYVVETTSSDFTVTTADIATATGSGTDTVSVTAGDTMLLGSHMVDGLVTTSLDLASASVDVSLNTAGDTVTLTRQATTGDVTWHGQLVEFSDGTTVSRATETNPTSVATDNVTVSVSDYTFCLPMISGAMGGAFSGSKNLNGVGVVDGLQSVQLTSNINLRIQSSSGQTNQTVTSWQIMEWGTGGGEPPATRRVMVIS